MTKKIFIAILFYFSFIQNGLTYSSDPEIFISEIVQEAKDVLVDNNSREFKTKKLSDLALKTVDIKMVANYSLGAYKKKLDEDQLKKYFILFEKYFLKSFSSRLTDYSEPKIEVLSSKVLNPKYTIVNSLLLATDKKPEVKIDWRISTKNQDKPLIVDLIVEGLSLARATKEEFYSVIESNNGDISKLFDTLQIFISK